MTIRVLDETGHERSRVDAGGTGVADVVGPIVSPDGTRIACAEIRSGDHWRVQVRRLDGTRPDVASDQEFTGAAASLQWSPDGRTVVVNHHFFPGTWLIDANAGTTRQASWTDPGYSAWQRLAP